MPKCKPIRCQEACVPLFRYFVNQQPAILNTQQTITPDCPVGFTCDDDPVDIPEGSKRIVPDVGPYDPDIQGSYEDEANDIPALPQNPTPSIRRIYSKEMRVWCDDIGMGPGGLGTFVIPWGWLQIDLMPEDNQTTAQNTINTLALNEAKASLSQMLALNQVQCGLIADAPTPLDLGEDVADHLGTFTVNRILGSQTPMWSGMGEVRTNYLGGGFEIQFYDPFPPFDPTVATWSNFDIRTYKLGGDGDITSYEWSPMGSPPLTNSRSDYPTLYNDILLFHGSGWPTYSWWKPMSLWLQSDNNWAEPPTDPPTTNPQRTGVGEPHQFELTQIELPIAAVAAWPRDKGFNIKNWNLIKGRFIAPQGAFPAVPGSVEWDGVFPDAVASEMENYHTAERNFYQWRHRDSAVPSLPTELSGANLSVSNTRIQFWDNTTPIDPSRGTWVLWIGFSSSGPERGWIGYKTTGTSPAGWYKIHPWNTGGTWSGVPFNKIPVRLVRTYQFPLTLYSGGTLSGPGQLIIDEVHASVGDRVLIAGQTNPRENGIYVVTNAGSPASFWAMARASDANTSALIVRGHWTVITEGEVWANTNWQLQYKADSPILDTTPLIYGEMVRDLEIAWNP